MDEVMVRCEVRIEYHDKVSIRVVISVLDIPSFFHITFVLSGEVLESKFLCEMPMLFFPDIIEDIDFFVLIGNPRY